MAHRLLVDSREPGPLSYEDDALQTQLIVGLHSTEHQTKIITAADQCPDFETTYRRLQAMQTAENGEKKLYNTVRPRTHRRSITRHSYSLTSRQPIVRHTGNRSFKSPFNIPAQAGQGTRMPSATGVASDT